MPIHILRSLQVPSFARDSVVTLGNFDGMHIGHQALLKQTVTIAKELKRASVAITFYPHPVEYFTGKQAYVRLSSFRDKVLMMQALGIDYLIFLKFNQELVNQTAEQFVNSVLFSALHAQYVVIGGDFRFGHERQGDVAYLKALAPTYQFIVKCMPQYDYKGMRVSSTRVRKALLNGHLDLASHLLGRPYAVTGHVQYGDALGRQLGFPTINLAWRNAPPLTGIYTVLVHGIDKRPIQGVASSGTRPTVNGTKPLLEVHLLNFDREIYGKLVTVEFCHKLREEERFATLVALKEHIARDVIKAKEYFEGKNR